MSWSFCIKSINAGEHQKNGETWNSAVLGWEAWLTPRYVLVSSCVTTSDLVVLRQRVCVWIEGTPKMKSTGGLDDSSATKGVCINRRNSKNDEHWGPGYSTWAWRTDEHRPTAKMCLCIASFDSVAVAEVQWQKLCIDACALLFRLHIVEYSVAFMTLFWCVLMCCVWSRNCTSLVMSLLYALFLMLW